MSVQEPTITSTGDFPATWVGNVSLTLGIDLPNPMYDCFLMFAIDNAFITSFELGNNPSSDGTSYEHRDIPVTLDTTKVLDGPHKLTCVTWWLPADGVVNNLPHSNGQRLYGQNYVWDIVTKNGQSTRCLTSRFQEVVMKVGDTLDLWNPLSYNCDGTNAYVKGNYRIVNGDCVAVQGTTITAQAEGFAVLQPDNPKAVPTRIVVKNDNSLPRFTKSGKLANQTTDDSYVPRSIFALEVLSLKEPIGQVTDLGINTLEQGIVVPPNQDNPTLDSYLGGVKWYVQLVIDKAKQYQLPILCGGDNLTYTAALLDSAANNDWEKEGLQVTMSMMKGLTIGMEICDETGRDPHISVPPSDSIHKMIDNLRASPDTMPLAWPVFSLAGENVMTAYNDSALSDYASIQWTFCTYVMGWETSPPPQSFSFEALRFDQFERLVNNRVAYKFLSRPLMSDVSILEFPGSPLNTKFTPEAISLQVMVGMVAGAVGVRAYNYSLPFTDLRMQALGKAYNLIGKIESFLLQPLATAPSVCPGVLTTVRKGDGKQLFMAVNCCDYPVTISVPLDSVFGKAHGQLRKHSLLGTNLGEYTVPAGWATDKPKLNPGQSIVYTLG